MASILPETTTAENKSANHVANFFKEHMLGQTIKKSNFTNFSRSRSKAVELLARVYDHVEHKYVRGFRMLTLGWSDGNTFEAVGLLPAQF